MPHIPSTWKERKESDLQHKVERALSDQRFQWLRSRTARRVLVVVSALTCVAIIPAYAAGNSVIGIVVTVAGFAMWWLLRISVRTVADLPDRFLDERQRAIRNRAYVSAYRVYASIIGGLATIGLVAFILVSENDAVTLTTTWNQAIGGVLFVLVIASVLPSMVVAWQDAGERDV
jgi:uncharacterized membrane protein